MSSHYAIRVEDLAKRYVINHRNDARDGLRHRMESALRNPFRWLREAALRTDRHPSRTATREEFWALRDVSFDINRGDVVGIIGRNGAGKSTLLKILSRITEPTHGRITLKGRVASLLEVGTGFHQELTGSENIYLNGAILGMSKIEIRRKFDEIVAFSEVEKFLDTPVKRYSSGMYVRLAFAVAAHLEPEILIVDEVLAVGDTAFQKKCLGKMGEVAKGGRTVLFVSHNMPAVQTLCSKAIYLQSGKVKASGPVEAMLKIYNADTRIQQGQHFNGSIKLGENFSLTTVDFSPTQVTNGRPLSFSLNFHANQAGVIKEAALIVFSAEDTRVAIVDLRPFGLPLTLEAGAECQVVGKIASVPLVEGEYSVGLYADVTGFVGNTLGLASLSVVHRARTQKHAPYAITYRGLVELDATATVMRSVLS